LADDVEETEDAGEYAGEEDQPHDEEADADADMHEEKHGGGEFGGVKSEILAEDGTKFKAEPGAASAAAEPKHAGDVKPGHAVPSNLRSTTSYMTKYERARILGPSISTHGVWQHADDGRTIQHERGSINAALPLFTLAHSCALSVPFPRTLSPPLLSLSLSQARVPFKSVWVLLCWLSWVMRLIRSRLR
jgi:hypothetical protein